MLHDEAPTETAVKGLDIAFILHADHELNASTFTARTVAATLADFYGATTSAIASLSGPLHGGANEEVVKMLAEKGINIARRTVAKYRAELNILPSNLRKVY